MRRIEEEKFIADNWDLMSPKEQEEVKEYLRKAFKKAYYFILAKKEREQVGK